MAQSLTSLHSDLRIAIYPRACTRYYGTAAQLMAEGLIPGGFKWPHKASRMSFEMGAYTHYLRRSRPDGIKGHVTGLSDCDHWCLQRSPTAELGHSWHQAQLYEKTLELAELLRRDTPEWQRTFHRAYETRKDAKYQAFRLQLLGEPKRGRGRPAKTAATSNTKTQGVNNV